MKTKNQIQVVSVDRPNQQRCVVTLQGQVLKRGSIEDCRDFVKCNPQFNNVFIH